MEMWFEVSGNSENTCVLKIGNLCILALEGGHGIINGLLYCSCWLIMRFLLICESLQYTWFNVVVVFNYEDNESAFYSLENKS